MAITGGTPQRRSKVAAIAAKSLATGVLSLSLYPSTNKQTKHMELVDDSRDDESFDTDWAGHCPIETPRDTTTTETNKNNPFNDTNHNGCEEEDVHYFWEAKSVMSDNDDDSDSDDDDVHYFWATAASSDVALDIISQTNNNSKHACGHTCKYCKGASFDSESTMLAHQAICAFSYDQQGLIQDGTYFLSNEYDDKEIDLTTSTSDQNNIGNTTFAMQLMPETYCASTEESIVGINMIKDSDPSSNSILAIKHATDKYFEDGASFMDKSDPFFQYSADTDDLLASSSSGSAETIGASEEEEGPLMLSFFRMAPPSEDTAYDDMPLLVRVVGGGNQKDGSSIYKNRKNIRIRLSQILKMKLVKFPHNKKKRDFVRVARPRTKTCMDAFLQVRNTPWRPVTLGSNMARNSKSIGDPKLDQFDVLEEFYTESSGSEE